MRTVLIVLVLAFSSFAAHAYTPELASLPTVALTRLDITSVKAAVASAKGQPLQFAVGAAMSTTQDAGTWDEPEPGLARWRLRVASSGAHSLSFGFDALSLPANAELYLYTNDGADVQGPYTARRNGRFVSPLVRGEEAVIEARMPVDEKSQFSLKLTRAFHAFRDLSGKSFSNTTGDSGACEIDIACPVGDNYSQQARSTVLLTIVNGLAEYLCSGSLVNNTAEDGSPYVLTANHCGVDDRNVDQTTVYFNVQRSDCGGGTAGTVTQNITGAAVLAGTTGKKVTDYTLFELASTPPGSFNAYYAGWDISGSAPASGAVIHHPAGDDKKISTYTHAANGASNVCIGTGLGCLGGFRIEAWEVYWATGTTEEGSSGSGLLNQNKRIVGTLSGGNGGCSGASNNGGADYFARLDQAWTASSVTGATLKSVLDPSGSGKTALDGKDASKLGNGSSTSGGTTDSGSASSDDSSGGGGSVDLWLMPLLLVGLRRRLISRRACRA